MVFSMVAVIAVVITGASVRNASASDCRAINRQKVCVGDVFMHHYGGKNSSSVNYDYYPPILWTASTGDVEGEVTRVYADGTVKFHYMASTVDGYEIHVTDTFTNPKASDLIRRTPCLANGICVGKRYMHHYGGKWGEVEGTVVRVYADGTVKYNFDYFDSEGMANPATGTFKNPGTSDLVPIGCLDDNDCHSLADTKLKDAMAILDPRRGNVSVEDDAPSKAFESSDPESNQSTEQKTSVTSVAI